MRRWWVGYLPKTTDIQKPSKGGRGEGKKEGSEKIQSNEWCICAIPSQGSAGPGPSPFVRSLVCFSLWLSGCTLGSSKFLYRSPSLTLPYVEAAVNYASILAALPQPARLTGPTFFFNSYSPIFENHGDSDWDDRNGSAQRQGANILTSTLPRRTRHFSSVCRACLKGIQAAQQVGHGWGEQQCVFTLRSVKQCLLMGQHQQLKLQTCKGR